MSIDTSSLRPLHPDVDLETLDYNPIQFNLVIDEDTSIVARCVHLRHPEMQKPDEIWQHVSGAEMWGLLRNDDGIEELLISFTDPILVVAIKYLGESDHYYISGEEWNDFVTYCQSATQLDEEEREYPHWQWDMEDYEAFVNGRWQRHSPTKHNWATEGF